MKLSKRLAAFSVVLLTAFLVAACSDSTPTVPVATRTPAQAVSTAVPSQFATTTAASTTASTTQAVTTTSAPSTTLTATTVAAAATTTAPTTTAITTTAATSPAVATTAATATPVAANPITPPLAGPFAYGVASGDMTSDSVVLWTRTASAASLTPELSLSQNFDSVTALPVVQTTAASDYTVKITAANLQPGTKYYYRFKAGSETSPLGSFKTAYAPGQDAPVAMAFSGDADWKWKPYPLLNNLVKENLDFYFFLGDLLYETTNLPGTTSVEDLDGYRFKYRENREPRSNSPSKMLPMLDLYRLFGQYSVFDNHETGLSKEKNAPPYNEGGVQTNGQFVNQSEGYRARIRAYRDYQPVSEEVVVGTGDARSDLTNKFYRTIPWGANMEMLILDDRSYRDARLPNSDDPAATNCTRNMLGVPQLKWFEDELLSAKQRQVVWKVVVVSSPMQQLGRASQIGADLDGGKSWSGGYNCERSKILKFVDDNAIDNVVFLTTDNHYTVINNLKYNSLPEDPKSPLKAARNAIEILTGPIGASAGNPTGLKVDTKGLPIREADRKILAVWNGDAANTDGQLKGLKQAGLDPIGLEADFPGLDTASVKSTGGTPGTIEALNFASFNTYAYAVLNFDKTSLSVQVKGFPIVPDPAVLASTEAIKEYEGRQAQEILSFRLKAQ